jgi:hypothetical protein
MYLFIGIFFSSRQAEVSIISNARTVLKHIKNKGSFAGKH